MKELANKSCAQMFRHICDNLDQDLDSPKCRAIRTHLDGCGDCLTYLDSLKKTIDLYKSYPVPPISSAARKFLRRIGTSR